MSTLKVSIPPHLRETLEPLIGIISTELEQLILSALEGSEIMYTTLVDVSKWALTEEGKQKLELKSLSKSHRTRIFHFQPIHSLAVCKPSYSPSDRILIPSF